MEYYALDDDGWVSIFVVLGDFLKTFHNSPHQIYQSYEWHVLIHYLENCWQIDMALP